MGVRWDGEVKVVGREGSGEMKKSASVGVGVGVGVGVSAFPKKSPSTSQLTNTTRSLQTKTPAAPHTHGSSRPTSPISPQSDRRHQHHHHQFDDRSCSSVHGRFEEISYQVEGEGQHGDGGDVVVVCGEGGNNNRIHYADIWGLRDSRSDDGEEEHGTSVSLSRRKKVRGEWWSENEIRRELRWLKARHKRVRDHQTICERPSSASPPLLYRAFSLPVDAVDI